MTFSTIHVSNSILKRSFENDVYISPMKLQRILYFVANEYVKQTGKNLFDESFGAWQYGPVLRSVYDKFSTFGDRNINKYGKDANGQGYCVDESKNRVLKTILDSVLAKTQPVSAVTLSRISILPCSAWNTAYVMGYEYIRDEDFVRDFSYYHMLGFSQDMLV